MDEQIRLAALVLQSPDEPATAKQLATALLQMDGRLFEAQKATADHAARTDKLIGIIEKLLSQMPFEKGY